MLHEIDLSRADLNLLVLFETIYEERHIGRAARRLNLSPSAVSHGLGRLRRLLNDPLFLKTPKGVVPTARAAELAAPIASALREVRGVLARTEPFDPSRSTRRFVLGAPDGMSAVILSPLLQALRRAAPGIDLAVRQVLPQAGNIAPEHAWRGALEDLEARTLDVAIIPTDATPARFHRRLMFEEDFAILVRRGHPLTEDPSLERYCAAEHLVVSATGDAYGFVDAALAELGHARRIGLTLPHFMFALPVLAETDLACAVPRRFAHMFGRRFDLVAVAPPLPLPRFRLNAVVPEPALGDAGLAWLLARLAEAAGDRSGAADVSG
jgi:DNA-binding transcriptional LysR family regulator